MPLSFVVFTFLGWLFAAGLSDAEAEKRIRIFWHKEGEEDKGTLTGEHCKSTEKRQQKGISEIRMVGFCKI